MNLSVNVANGTYWIFELISRLYITQLFPDGDPPVMAYLATCTLFPQTTHAILDIQTGTLLSNSTSKAPRAWNLWSPDINAERFSDLMAAVSSIFSLFTHCYIIMDQVENAFYLSAFGICPQNGFTECSMLDRYASNLIVLYFGD